MNFRAPRKGENYELSVDLNSEYREKRKDAIKRVIASMTVGKGARVVHHPSLFAIPNRVSRCQRALSRRAQEHADRRLGTEEARVLVSDELRQDSAGARYLGGQHVRQGYR